MKKNRKLKHLMLFASSGAIACTGSAAFADDARPIEHSGTYKVEEKVQVRTDSDLNRSDEQYHGQVMREPSGAERYSSSSSMRMQRFGTVQRASDLIGMPVRNHQNEKLGDIRDVMVDLNTGRIPFAILSSDVGNRLVAIPPSALNMAARDGALSLNMDRERLRSAPSFERNRWPDMSNHQWSSDVYRYYGVPPYVGASYQGMQPYHREEVYTESSVIEPSGAEWQRSDSRYYQSSRHHYSGERELGEVDGITRLDDISGNRSRGGAVDLQPFAHRNEGPVGWTSRSSTTTTRGYQAADKQRHHAMASDSRMGGYYRASDLIGMNIRNAQGETVGEIQDMVVDLNSGHVAYAVVDANRFLNIREGFVPVPPSMLRIGPDSKTVSLVADRDMLINAPRFERNNWSEASSEHYVSRVYSHYGQQPYWQAQGQFQQGTQFREPSGAENYNRRDQYQEYNLNGEQQFQSEPQQNDSSFRHDGTFEEPTDSGSLGQEQGFNEPSGAELQGEQPDRSIDEPAGAERSDESSSATLETQEVQEQESVEQKSATATSTPDSSVETSTETQSPSELQSEIEEPSGAEVKETAPEAQKDIVEPQRDESGSTLAPDAQSNAADAAQPKTGSELESEVSVHNDQQAGAALHEPAGAEISSEYPVPTRTRGAEVSEPAGAESQVRTEDSYAQQVQDAAGAANTASAGGGAIVSPKLLQQVQSSLKSDAALQADNIQVTSENGKIVLKGSVQSETQKQQIEQKVQDVLFENRIQVHGAQEQSKGTPSQP